jgi:hypothetical protein
MTDHTEDRDAFATTLQVVYHEVRLHSPQGLGDVEKVCEASPRPMASP